MAKYRKGKLSKNEREALTIKAMTEFGDGALYAIKDGTIGKTLYAYADTRKDAHKIRLLMPLKWNNLHCIVIYDSDPEPVDEDEEFEWMDPALYSPEK